MYAVTGQKKIPDWSDVRECVHGGAKPPFLSCTGSSARLVRGPRSEETGASARPETGDQRGTDDPVPRRAGNEHRIRHRRDARYEVRGTALFLAVHEEAQTDRAQQERGDEISGREVHVPSIGPPLASDGALPGSAPPEPSPVVQARDPPEPRIDMGTRRDCG